MTYGHPERRAGVDRVLRSVVGGVVGVTSGVESVTGVRKLGEARDSKAAIHVFEAKLDQLKVKNRTPDEISQYATISRQVF